MGMERVILGDGCIYCSDSNVTGLNNNILVCGGSGSGKTMSISEPRLLESWFSSLIVNVTKRRIVDQYAPMLLERGYDALELNFADPGHGNCSYDPLPYVQNDADAIFLAQAIVNANPRKQNSAADPYWDDTAISLLAAEIAYIKGRRRWNASPTFADVLDLHGRLRITNAGESIMTSLDGEFNALDQGSFAATCWRSFHDLPPRTARCVYGTLNTTIDTLFPPSIRMAIAGRPGVDFTSVATQKTALFVVTSAVKQAAHCFANLFFSQAIKSLFEYAENLPGGELPVPVHMLCDDFATGSRILNFPEFISIFREKGISVTLLVQSESQLESIYGLSDMTTIINNCDSYVYTGGMDVKTAQSISLRLNKPLEDVLYMPIGQIAVIRRGHKPVITRRYDISRDTRYQKIMQAYAGRG